MDIIELIKKALIDSGVSATQVNAMSVEQLIAACNCRNIQLQVYNNKPDSNTDNEESSITEYQTETTSLASESEEETPEHAEDEQIEEPQVVEVEEVVEETIEEETQEAEEETSEQAEDEQIEEPQVIEVVEEVEETTKEEQHETKDETPEQTVDEEVEEPQVVEVVKEVEETAEEEPQEAEEVKPIETPQDETIKETNVYKNNNEQNTDLPKIDPKVQQANINKLKEVLANENGKIEDSVIIDFSKACTKDDPYTIIYNKLVEKKNRQLSTALTAIKSGRIIIAIKMTFSAIKIGYETCTVPKNIPDTYVKRTFITFIKNFITTCGGIFSSDYEPPEQMQLLLGNIDKDKDMKALKQLLKATPSNYIQKGCNRLIAELELKFNECESEITKLTRQLLKGNFKKEEEIINYYRVQTTNRYSLNTIERTMAFYQEINNILINRKYISALIQEDNEFPNNAKKQRIKKIIKELENLLRDLLLNFDPNIRSVLIDDLRKECLENN